jgi:hypothetical protein
VRESERQTSDCPYRLWVTSLGWQAPT